jgi:hypothetical protein
VRSEEVTIDPRFYRVNARHHGDPGWVACWRGAVGVGEGDGLFGQAVEVGSDDPRVLSEGRDVVIEIID